MEQIPKLIEIDNIFEIKTINSMFVFNFKKYYKCPVQSHEPIELIFVADGKENVGEGDKIFQLEKDQIFIHDSLVPHYDECISDTSTVYVFTFTAKSEFLPKLFNRVISLTSEQIATIKDVFNFAFDNINPSTGYFHFDQRYISDEPQYIYGSSQALKNKIENFFISIINSVSYEEKRDKSYYSDPLISKIITILEEEKMNPFSLDNLAERTNYSKSYLCRYFKSRMKTNLNTYFHYLKIDASKKLLLDPNLSVEEVSSMTGFESVQYFSLVFKKYTGSSPSAWRTIYFH